MGADGYCTPTAALYYFCMNKLMLWSYVIFCLRYEILNYHVGARVCMRVGYVRVYVMHKSTYSNGNDAKLRFKPVSVWTKPVSVCTKKVCEFKWHWKYKVRCWYNFQVETYPNFVHPALPAVSNTRWPTWKGSPTTLTCERLQSHGPQQYWIRTISYWEVVVYCHGHGTTMEICSLVDTLGCWHELGTILLWSFTQRYILSTETPRGGATSASLSSVRPLLLLFQNPAAVEQLIHSTATYQSCAISMMKCCTTLTVLVTGIHYS